MRTKTFILILVGIVLVNILAQFCFFRFDMTSDKRYSLSQPTKTLFTTLDKEVTVTLFLAGDLNSGFTRLQNATEELLDELSLFGHVRYQSVDPLSLAPQDQQILNEKLMKAGLHPTAIYEQTAQGQQQQTIVYPFAKITYGGKETFVSLLQNNRSFSGAENLNHSIESLEYCFAEAVKILSQEQRPKVAFLEGHGELPEQYTADIEAALAQYFDVYRGAITPDIECLNPFDALIVADPQVPFTEQDKYIIDQYVMQGGSVLWLVNGVRFSENALSEAGSTPIIPLELNLTDLFFRYGVRINSCLVQDLQCLSVPVDVSTNPQQPQYQPMPWTYAPLLLTSGASPITRNLMQVSATFASNLDLVGGIAVGNQTTNSAILLATASASSITPSPGEVNLSNLRVDEANFTYQLVPISVLIEGSFPSLFTHRMIPEGLVSTAEKRTESLATRQVWVACGSVIRNEMQNGQPLPLGYDRYSRTQFGNRDFILNTMLYLTDEDGLINLRQKTIPLRMLNKQALQKAGISATTIAITLPLILLTIVGGITFGIRRKKYTNLK